MTSADYAWLAARMAFVALGLITAVIVVPRLYDALWRLRMRRRGRKAMQRINAKYRAMRTK